MTTPVQSPPVQPTVTDYLGAQYKVQQATLKLLSESNEQLTLKLNELTSTVNTQNVQTAKLIQAISKKDNSLPTTMAISLFVGLAIASWWASAYISQTIIGDSELPLWDYVNGIKYGIGLSGAEILFVVLTRFLLGFSGGFTGSACALAVMRGLISLLKNVFKPD